MRSLFLPIALWLISNAASAAGPGRAPPNARVLAGIDSKGYFENRTQLEKLKQQDASAYERQRKNLDGLKQDYQDALKDLGSAFMGYPLSKANLERIGKALAEKAASRAKTKAATRAPSSEVVISGEGIPKILSFAGKRKD